MPESPELTLLRDIFHFLQSPEADSLLHIHPNQLCSPSFSVPSLWHCWWTWAGELDNASTPEENVMDTSPDPKWLRLLRHYASPDDARLDIPLELKELVDVARRLQITRHPGPVLPVSTPPLPDDPPHHPGCLLRHAELSMKSKHSSNGESGFVEAVMDPSWSRGMSPKKAHEVLRMTEFTSRLLSQPSLRGVRHVVDVGAGQVCLDIRPGSALSLSVAQNQHGSSVVRIPLRSQPIIACRAIMGHVHRG
ncbi:hypothetical protein B0H21DRAFT_84209 [Amylocystis lapponica]|nr:hypothetical protein B0H21DRAFT_84209 [Amylocystis lapponica]